MNKELLENRLTEINRAIEINTNNFQQISHNLKLLEGGKSETLYWLNQLKESQDVCQPAPVKVMERQSSKKTRGKRNG